MEYLLDSLPRFRDVIPRAGLLFRNKLAQFRPSKAESFTNWRRSILLVHSQVGSRSFTGLRFASVAQIMLFSCAQFVVHPEEYVVRCSWMTILEACQAISLL